MADRMRLVLLAASLWAGASTVEAQSEICSFDSKGEHQFLNYVMMPNGVAPLDTRAALERGLATSCNSNISTREPRFYALSLGDFGPLVLGSPCEKVPVLVFRTWAAGGRLNNLASFLETSPAGTKHLSHDLVAKADIKDMSDWRANYGWVEKLPLFEQLALVALRLIQRQCGTAPSQASFVVAFGESKEVTLSQPQSMTIRAKSTSDGWSFDFPDLAEAQAVNVRGIKLHDEKWAEAYRPKSASEQADARNAELRRWAQGLLLSLAGSAPGGRFDVCNNGNNRLRFSFISLVPSSDPIVFIEGFHVADAGECAEISGDVHPLMVYGVAIEQELEAGLFIPFHGTIRNPSKEAIPHQFTHICAPPSESFTRKDTGMVAANTCQVGDVKLPVSFNVRVGRTNFTMNVN